MPIEKRFFKLLRKLPPNIQELAPIVVADPHKRPYRLKAVKGKRLRKGSWSVRVTDQGYRAIGEKAGSDFSWYWVGTREDYNGMTG